MMRTAKKYILYCSQSPSINLGRVQDHGAKPPTRSMLIPYNLIIKCKERNKDLEILRANSMKNVVLETLGVKCVVDQLLVHNMATNGRSEDTFSQIICDLTDYADGLDDGSIRKQYDSVWANNVICGVASSGPSDVINYCDFRKTTGYNGHSVDIVEGFLVLESTTFESLVSAAKEQ